MIAILVTASAYYLSADYGSKNTVAKESATLSAKKEELLASQTNMDNKIAELQQNVQIAIQQQQKLNTQVGQLQKDITTLDPSKGSTVSSTTTYTPPVIKTPTVTPTPVYRPTPTPAPAPTTRAS